MPRSSSLLVRDRAATPSASRGAALGRLLAPLGALLAAAFALGTTGCAYKRTEGVTSNGEAHVLYFGGLASAPLLAANHASTITVARLPGGEVDCHPLGIKSAGGDLHAQGGGHPDLPADTCDSIPAEPVELQSATCDDDACTVTSSPSDRGVSLAVTAPSAAATHLRVTLRSTKDGALYTDSIPIHFAVATRIRVGGAPDDLLPLHLPVLPGVPMRIPYGDVVDAAGEVLTLEDGALSSRLDGDGWVAGDYDQLIATRPGHTTLHYAVDGLITRDVDLEIVSADEVASVEVLPRDDRAIAGSVDTADLDDLPSAPAPIDSVEVPSAAWLGATFPTRARLRDGRVALGVVERVDVQPSVFATAEPDLLDPWAFDLQKTPAVGDGTLVVHVSGADVSIPLHVGPPATSH